MALIPTTAALSIGVAVGAAVPTLAQVAPMDATPVQWLGWFVQLGSFGLVAYLIVFGLPKAMRLANEILSEQRTAFAQQLNEQRIAFAQELKLEREMWTVMRREQDERHGTAMQENTAATRQLASVIADRLPRV